MKQLHLVFNVVKLTLALDDLITEWKMEDHPLPIVINREAEWEVKKILDSCWHWRRFQYLKWKGYGHKHNSWESAVILDSCLGSKRDIFHLNNENN